MRKFLLSVLLLLIACAPAPRLSATPHPKATLRPSATVSPSPLPAASATPTTTPAPSATPAPLWQIQGPGRVTCVILLYHRIAIPTEPNDYFVTPADFRAQLQALADWGYTSIPLSLLIRAVNEGAPLPPRPIVISFDDGDISVYETAFPLMQEFGFSGINYIVSNRLHSPGYMTAEQLAELAQAGWEVGSHSVSHADLLADPNPRWQLEQSRRELEAALGQPITTFAWPFGNSSPALRAIAAESYRAAVGLGPQLSQTPASLFYMRRRPVLYGWDLTTFGSYLPWNNAP